MAPTVYVGRLTQGEWDRIPRERVLKPAGVTKQDIEDVRARRPTVADYKHFKGLGRIVDIRLMANFGFVEFENADVSEKIRDCTLTL